MRACFLLLSTMAIAACGGSTSTPAPPPLPGESVMSVPGGVNALVGSSEGVVLASGDGLHVFRGDASPATIDGNEYWQCHDRDLFTSVAVARDRVFIARASCGIWSYRDGDPSRREVVVRTATKASDGATKIAFAWSENDGSPKPRWNELGPWIKVAAHDDTLFLCMAKETPLGSSDVPPLEIWSMTLDGAHRERLVSRRGLICDDLHAEADAVYAMGASEIFRIDRATRVVDVLVPYTPSVLRDGLVVTSTHVAWKETRLSSNDGHVEETILLARVPLRGGNVEAIPTANDPRYARLVSDGAAIFLSSEVGMFRVAPGPETRLTSEPWLRDVAGGLGFVWWVREPDRAKTTKTELVRLPD